MAGNCICMTYPWFVLFFFAFTHLCLFFLIFYPFLMGNTADKCISFFSKINNMLPLCSIVKEDTNTYRQKIANYILRHPKNLKTTAAVKKFISSDT